MDLKGYWDSVQGDPGLPAGANGHDLRGVQRKAAMFSTPLVYKGYEKFGKFRTPTGKVELYAEYLTMLGISPCPASKSLTKAR
ncbi:MAG: hypothetical protein MZU91_01720 [Desulfosudis oleivorans]|nr:hypothetical protein [Desulfosudis oleivorans]